MFARGRRPGQHRPMRGSLTVAVILFVASVAAGPAATAQTPSDLNDAVPGHPGVTYLALMQQAIPDLAYNPATRQVEGHLKSLRHIMGKAAGGEPPDPVVVSFVEDIRLNAGGRPRIAVLADLGQSKDSAQSTTLLALFDNAPKPRVLDAVDVGVDKETSFDQHPTLTLGPGDDALVTYSEHFNSNQTYAQRLMIFVRGDRLRLIDDLFLLSDSACGFKRAETPTFATRPASPYATLVVTVTETLKHLDEQCDAPPPAPYVHTYQATYRWDAARGGFVGQGDLDKLDKLNQGRL